MLGRLAALVIARRRLVLLVAVALSVVAVVVGSSAPDAMQFGGDDDPRSESSRAEAAMETDFDGGVPNLVLLVDSPRDVDDPEVAARGLELTEALAAEPGVVRVISYWQWQVPLLRSKDGKAALIVATIRGEPPAVREITGRVSVRFTLDEPLVTVRIGGSAEIARQFEEQSGRDLVRAELIALPALLLMLVLVFRSVVAAVLPLVIGVVTVVGALAILRVVAALTDVSVFALNLTTGLSLGLAVDYSLLVVSRYREELAAGGTTEEAVERTIATAGHTVLWSAIIVASSLAALAIMPMYYLRSFGYAGIAVVALAALAAVVVLPAILCTLGPRIDVWTIRRRRATGESRFWRRLATFVMRRPIAVAAVATAVLLAAGVPFLDVRFGLADERALPPSLTARQVHDTIRARFATEELTAVVVVARSFEAADRAALETYAARLSALPDVAHVETVTGRYERGVAVAEPTLVSLRFSGPAAVWLSVVPSVDAVSPAGEQVARAVRAEPAPFPVLVGGPAAQLLDEKATLARYAPIVLAWIAAVTFVVLLLMTRSLLVPLKALVLGALSLTATFGAMVWVFQQGHLSGVLGFTPTGSLETTTPLLMVCIAFGLSMDYEVFLLARVREEYLRTGDNEASVATGLEHTAGVITAASAILAIVFGAFATSGISLVKLFGIGLALAILVDATIIRALLVPAFMRLAGRANWWAPRWLRR